MILWQEDGIFTTSVTSLFPQAEQKATQTSILVSFWEEINNITEADDSSSNTCLCYNSCNHTLYSQEISWALYPGPLADKSGIASKVFKQHLTESHICYAK